MILYTPTFRSDFSFTYYDVDLATIKSYFERETKEKYIILVRLHPRMMYKSDEINNFFGKEKIYNVTLYPDIQELLYAADVLVTDYSSTMFDFMYSLKPVILYVPDKEIYNRGFYFDMNEMPFIIANNNAELPIVLQKYDRDEYINKVHAFLKRIGNVETGKATEKAYHLLIGDNSQ